MKPSILHKTVAAALLALGAAAPGALASSHREAPAITAMPKLDGTDFYMFTSYEAGREDFVTIIADYQPVQNPGDGPNYYELETNGVYEIHIDNVGDGTEHLTFQFQFTNTEQNLTVPVGGVNQPVALKVIAPITPGSEPGLNVIETYTVNMITGPRRTGTVAAVTNAADGTAVFTKPTENIGNKSIPDYNAYAAQYMYAINIPGCATPGRMFVGQRKDPFVVNLGEAFDLINISTGVLGPTDKNLDSLRDKNVTCFVLELPKACLRSSAAQPVIGGWTTSSTKAADGTLTQVSRLANPLVNELVIGLKDKNTFNGSEPTNDAQFATYVTNPTFPAIVEILYGSAGVKAPTLFPRTDLVQVFLTGIPNVNQNGSTAEMMRLNLDTPSVPAAQQKNLGLAAGDAAGYPNGRRPGDDAVDITLRVAMGKLLSAADAPSGQLPFTDGAYTDATRYMSVFPYVNPPLPGSPNTVDPFQNPFLPFLGFVFTNSEDAGVYVFDKGLNSELYTTPNLFPYLYDFQADTFIYYFTGSENPRQFYNFATQQYFSN